MNEPIKIFVVSKGDYSDNHNIGVFSTREAAEAVNGDYIEEWLLDNVQDAPGHYSLFEVVMHREGAVRRSGLTESYMRADNNPHFYSSGHCAAYLGDLSNCALFDVWAIDVNHAIKIVNEKRTQLIAEGKWQ